MNVSVPTIPDAQSIQQLNTKHDSSQDLNSGDHREFNDVIVKHESGHVSGKSGPAVRNEKADNQDDTFASRETAGKSEQHVHSANDNNDTTGESIENRKGGDQLSECGEAAGKIKGNDLNGISRNSEQSESGLSMEVLLSLLDLKVPKEGIDAIIRNAAAGNMEQPGSPDATVSGTGNEDEADALLLNVLQQSIETINKSLSDAVSDDAHQEEGETEAGTEGSLKRGAALFNLLQKAVAAAFVTPSVNGETGGDAEQAVKGMPAGDQVKKIESLLSDLLNKVGGKIPDSALPVSDLAEMPDKNVIAQQIAAGKGEAKSDAFNDISKMLNDDKTSPVEEKLSAEQIRAMRAASGKTQEAHQGKNSTAGKNTVHARNESGISQAPKEVSEIDLPENAGDPKTPVNRAVSEISEHISREGAAGEFISKSGRSVKLNPEDNNTHILHNSQTNGDGGRPSEGILTGSAARQPGFNELLDKAVYVAKGNNRLNVSVEHQDMGKIDIKLSLEKGVMNIHINTSDNAVRQYVESNIQSIIDSLAKNGVSVGGFSVALKNYKNGGEGSDGKDNPYITDRSRGKEYITAPAHVSRNNGLVNIFA